MSEDGGRHGFCSTNNVNNAAETTKSLIFHNEEISMQKCDSSYKFLSLIPALMLTRNVAHNLKAVQLFFYLVCFFLLYLCVTFTSAKRRLSPQNYVSIVRENIMRISLHLV